MVSSISNALKYPFRETSYPAPLLKVILFLGAIFSVWGASNGYFFKVLVAFSTLYLITRWFFTSQFTVGIFFALTYQWTQVVIKVFYGIINNIPLESLTKYPEQISTAYYYSAIGLTVLSYGIYSQLKKINYSQTEFNDSLTQYSPKKFLITYVAFSIGINLLFTFRFIIPGLFQAISLLNNFKWSLLFALFFIVHHNRKLTHAFWIIISLEFLSSFVSFFADFKSFIFFLIIPYLSYHQVTPGKIRVVGVIGLMAFIVAFIWTGVKSDYRNFLNQGTKSQSVLVEADQAGEYLVDIVTDLNLEEQKNTMRALVDRISYIDYFSACISYVPNNKAHENGKILKKSILHILMPRIIFPNKAAIDDSKHLNKYTGLYFADSSKGVSFSLGYIGDFYIDFGLVFMLIPIFILGYFVGFILLNLYKRCNSPFWGAAILSSSFMVLYKLENAQIKFIGNLIWYWIVFYLITKYLVPYLKSMLKTQND